MNRLKRTDKFLNRASSILCWKISPVGAFPCLPLINTHNGRVYDVIHCFILEKKMRSSILIKCLVTVFLHINYVPSSIYNEVDRFIACEQAFGRARWREGKAKKACRQTFGIAVPRYPLYIRSWCKLLLARTLTVDRPYWHRLFGRHVARDLITEWQ